MPWSRTLIVGLTAALLAACSIPTIDPKADALAKAVYDQVRKGDDAAVAREMAPQAQSATLPAQLAELRKFIPPGEPSSISQRGINISAEIGKGETSTYVYAYDYPDRTVMSQVTLFRTQSSLPWMVLGFHVNSELKGAAPPTAPAPSAVGGSGATADPTKTAP
jgi:hypothetical protein